MSAFKFSVHTDKMPGGWHAAYLDVYHRLFSPLKETEDYIGEIGVDGGGFTLALMEYFPNAIVRCMDISQCPKSLEDREEIVHFQMDAYTQEGVEAFKVGAKYSVLIDDGPHTLSSQEFFAEHYPHLLTDNGVAIIEDIAEHAHLEHLQRKVHRDFFTAGIDLTHHDNQRYDNRLLLIWRR